MQPPVEVQTILQPWEGIDLFTTRLVRARGRLVVALPGDVVGGLQLEEGDEVDVIVLPRGRVGDLIGLPSDAGTPGGR